jgi:AraC-like DNA-binding protein
MEDWSADCPPEWLERGFSGWVGLGSPLEVEKRVGLYVTKAGARRFPSGFGYQPDRDPHWEFGAVLSGELVLEFGGERFSVPGGSGYVMPPDRAMTARPVDDPLLVWVEWQGERAADFAALLGGKPGELTVGRFNPAQLASASRIVRCLYERPADFSLAAQAALWELSVMSRSPRGYSRAYDRHIRRTLEYLEGDGILRPVSLGEMSRVAGLSVEVFRKRFREQVGEAPARHALRLKVRRAKGYLVQQDKNVAEIAALCGFDDPYYFSRVFKKFEGVSPLAFRQQGLRGE